MGLGRHIWSCDHFPSQYLEKGSSFLSFSLYAAPGWSKWEAKRKKTKTKKVWVRLWNYVKAETSKHIMKSHFTAQIVDGWVCEGIKDRGEGEEGRGEWGRRKIGYREKHERKREDLKEWKRKKERNKRKKQEQLTDLLSISHPNLLP